MVSTLDGNIILDAGEGTLGQLYRQVGHKRWKTNDSTNLADMDTFLKRISLIFLSHLHADHHLGIIRLLKERYQLMINTNHSTKPKPIYIIAPHQFLIWLEEYSDIEDIGLKHMEFISAHDLLRNRNNANAPHRKKFNSIFLSISYSKFRLQRLLDDLNLTKIETTEAIHCIWSYSVGLEHKAGWKLVYSGDTRPCHRMLKLCDGSPDLLIHEATFEDDKFDEAIAKKHTTMSEAIDVGNK